MLIVNTYTTFRRKTVNNSLLLKDRSFELCSIFWDTEPLRRCFNCKARFLRFQGFSQGPFSFYSESQGNLELFVIIFVLGLSF